MDVGIVHEEVFDESRVVKSKANVTFKCLSIDRVASADKGTSGGNESMCGKRGMARKCGGRKKDERRGRAYEDEQTTTRRSSADADARRRKQMQDRGRRRRRRCGLRLTTEHEAPQSA